MKCYHMTSLDRLESISKQGLTPRNEENSKLINDDKVKVFFSEGYEGAIALFVDFELIYEKINNKEIVLDDKSLEEKVLNSKDFKNYLKEGVYLEFSGDNIENERNFENGCTNKTISPEILNVCILKDKETKETTYSRFDIIKYMMSKKQPQDIKYYGVKYEGSPNFDEATKRIQGKIKKYYEEHEQEINKFKNKKYDLEYIPIEIFMNEYYNLKVNKAKKR